MSIDFSKAPDSEFFEELFWDYQSKVGESDSKRMIFKEYCAKVLSNTNIITCDNERQKMLCEQVVRDYQGLRSQYRTGDGCEWLDVDSATCLDYGFEYRAKSKKELFIPWEFIPDDVAKVLVGGSGVIQFFFGGGDWCFPSIKLDLTDIELPVTVERPKC